jgi:adenosylcobinamide-GDP ribazoletransferase
VRALLLALGFLTRLPVPRLPARADDFAVAAPAYPLAGLAVGAVVAGAGWLGALVDPWTGALAALVAWTWVTGALHLDGLADVADGVGAGHGDAGRMLAAMADPHVGSFGVVALVAQMLAKLVLLHALLPGGWPLLVAIPGVARMGPLLWARWLPPLKAGGLGAMLAGAVRRRDLIGWAAVLAGGCWVAPPLLAAPAALVLIGGWFRHRLVGVTGDAHGAGIEVAETALLLAAVCVQP